MSLFLASPDRVWNPSILKFPTAPRKILQRGMVLPRGATWATTVRMVLEWQMVRFLLTLTPFLVVGLTWPGLALPLGASPIFMLLAIGLVELRLLRIPAKKRTSITTKADAARTLDTLQFRGRRILAEVAARRGIQTGLIYLVVEQSDIARLPPLTIVSLQLDEGKSRLSPLSPEERALIREGLFDDDLTEQDLLKANLREDAVLRSVKFEARGVSAHARLDALLNASPPTEEATA